MMPLPEPSAVFGTIKPQHAVTPAYHVLVPQEKKSYRLRHEHRLHGDKAFAHVLGQRATRRVGPLVVHGCPNDLGHPRMGIRIGRPIGNAVVRNRIKRLLREAFRLGRHDWPAGYDIIISVRRHEPGTLEDYQQWLATVAREMHRLWQKRQSKAEPSKSEPSDGVSERSGDR